MRITARQFYAGVDPATGDDFQLQAGESREVSTEKAEQLQRDLPSRFDFEGAKKKAPAKTRAKKSS